MGKGKLYLRVALLILTIFSLVSCKMLFSNTSWAFHQCTNMESIALEKCNHLTTIKDRSIRYNKLSKVIIPKSVTSIGDWAFQQKYL